MIAAGGIATDADIVRAMKAGAQGVMMGTRFIASDESLPHPAYKQALVAATAEQTVYTNCFDIGWPYAMSRVLKLTAATSKAVTIIYHRTETDSSSTESLRPVEEARSGMSRHGRFHR